MTLFVPPPPPAVWNLPAGTQLVAGLGLATVHPELDFETYSEAGFVWNDEHVNGRGKNEPRWEPLPGAKDKGLFAVGAARYAEHPSAEVLTCSYNLKDGKGKRRWRPGLPPPQDLFDHIARGGLLESHNCGFEFIIWEKVCRAKYGWPELPLSQQRCSMAKARAFGLPGGLDPLGEVLNLTHKKDPAGVALLKKFSVPQKPTKKDPRLRHRPEEEPEEGERLYAYCDRDVDAEAEASSRIPDLSPGELEWWQYDQMINRRGVAIDRVTVRAAINVIEQAFTQYNAELARITGGTVQRASELQKLKGWLGAHGVHCDAMDEDSIDDLLKERHRFPPHCVRALELRGLVGSASVKKLYAMENQATIDDRLFDLFTYHGAATGRATGNGPQPTNLPNSGPDVNVCGVCTRHYGLSKAACPWCGAAKPPAPPKPLPNRSVVEWCAEAAADAIEVIRTGSLHAVEYYFDHAVGTVSACLRGMFVAGPDHDLISSDYTAIEAVVLAELAGEQWRVDLFKAGGKIYEASGAKIEGLTYDEVIEYKKRTGNHHPCRKKGKVNELACGYGGWIGALRQFGADEFMTEDEMKASIIAWREASPMIVRFWGGQFVDPNGMPCASWMRNAQPGFTGLEGMAIQAVLYPGNRYTYRGISYYVHGDVLYCELLSGRRLAYHRPRLRNSERGGLALSYERWNTNPKNGPMGWTRVDTYGGKLTENVVQATARDVLVNAIVKLWRKGYATVLHVYDEIVAEVAKGFGSVEEFEAVMGEMPAWAAGWPIRAAGGWRGYRYRK
jgi:DNA polymerase